MIEKCPLCESESTHFHSIKNKIYNKCSLCKAIYLLKEFHLSAEQEKKHYLKHNNDVEDTNYQKFVSPISDYILLARKKEDKGLDFGSGTGPVISKLLTDKAYCIEQYDPFFKNNTNILNNKYDYIACCEVMEHFHKPKDEFTLLRKILNENGVLICKTVVYNESIDFEKWYYKNDPTHVFIYQKETLEWIKSHFKFRKLDIEPLLIRFYI